MVEQLRDEGSRAQVVVSGAIAGLVSRFVIAPLDVIKVGTGSYHNLFSQHTILILCLTDPTPAADPLVV